MQTSDAGKLRKLESENAKLKKLLAEVHLESEEKYKSIRGIPDVVFTPVVMDQVPDAADGKTCVCAKCVAEGR